MAPVSRAAAALVALALLCAQPATAIIYGGGLGYNNGFYQQGGFCASPPALRARCDGGRATRAAGSRRRLCIDDDASHFRRN